MLTYTSTRRTAATWIAGTGAFLLLAAASLFVAVRWEQLPDAVKLAVIGFLTGAFLAGGRWLRPGFPATGDALFHLGAFLLPVDLAAVNLRIGMGWRGLVLAEGVLAATAFGWMAARTGSAVLAWAGRTGMVALAAGAAGLSPLPAPLVLALAGAAAHAVGRHRAAISWSSVAGLAPVAGVTAAVALQAAGTQVGRGVLGELGLAGRAQSLAAVATGALVAVVLAREASRRRDLGLVAVAGVSVASGAVTTWAAAEPGLGLTMEALAAVFLGVQLAALLVRHDRFWSTPARWVADVSLAGTVTVALGGMVVLLPAVVLWPAVEGWSDPAAALTLGLMALAWLVAALRRVPVPAASWPAAGEVAGHPLGVLALAAAVAAVEAGTSTFAATALAMFLAAALLAVAGTEVAAAAAALFSVSAPGLAWRWPILAVAVAVAGGTAMAAAAVRRVGPAGPGDLVGAYVLAVVACWCGAEAAAFLVAEVGDGLALSVAVTGLWALAPLLDRGRHSLGDVARVATTVPPVVAVGLRPGQALSVAAVATVLLLFDAVRLDRPTVGLGPAAVVQLVVVHGCRLAGLTLAETGLALCVAAGVWSGVAVLVSARWQLPLLAAAGAGVVAGVALAAGDVGMLANALLVSGGIGVAAGVVSKSAVVGNTGGAVVVVGIMAHLSQSQVSALEAYLAPVTAQLLLVGLEVRRRAGVSSWVAYGPAVALLGGSAFAERLAGGAGWHAVVAGSVGVAAVAAGGWRRLAGPLMLGTGLVVAVTVVESLPALAGVPTWGWLAAGGAFLVLVGLALERTEASPAVAGRRLVDVIGERFE